MEGQHLFALLRRVADRAQQLLMVPDVVFQRRDIHIADRQHLGALAALQRVAPLRKLVIELELVGELVIDLGVGLRAARGDVEVMELQPAFQRDRGVAFVVLAAPDLDVFLLEGFAR